MKKYNLIAIGNNLKKYRMVKNISQRELAKLMKVSQREISYWETGKVLISTKKLFLMAKILNIDLNTIANEDLELCIGRSNSNES